MKAELADRFGVSSIGIFGSITREDFTDKSDIDILVDFSRPIGLDFITLADLLEERLHAKVDLVSSRFLKPRFYDSIKEDLIYV